jgi:hypothetical protein
MLDTGEKISNIWPLASTSLVCCDAFNHFKVCLPIKAMVKIKGKELVVVDLGHLILVCTQSGKKGELPKFTLLMDGKDPATFC